MLLRNIHAVESDCICDIAVQNEIIHSIALNNAISGSGHDTCVTFNDAIVFPGLINSHDHLDFNNFPQLGNRIYNNYIEWGDDIWLNNKDIIGAVLKIPKSLRIQWAVYKNLLAGVTTVVNHGSKLEIVNNLINVHQQSHSLHSVGNEKFWKLKLNFPGRQSLLSIHTGEGTDAISREEINSLINWNFFNRKIVGIHGVAMTAKQAERFKALVWCPDSNYFTLGRTAEIRELKKHTNILFGTDSTLTAGWNIWDHLRLARQEMAVSDRELFNMLTSAPAEIWPIPDCGKLESGMKADLVIARKKSNRNIMEVFYSTNPEDLLLVMHNGDIKLFDEEIMEQLSLSNMPLSGFSKISMKGEIKYVQGNLPVLIAEIKQYYPGAEFPFS